MPAASQTPYFVDDAAPRAASRPRPGSGIQRRYGKPFDYFRLGKGWRDGAEFMRHMKSSAERLLAEARRTGAVVCVERCPICDNPNVRDEFEYAGFTYARCCDGACGHAFVRERIAPELRETFFRGDTQYSRQNYCDAKRANFRVENIAGPKVDHVLEFVRPGARSWLDVGCGSGEILASLERHAGWDSVGLELSTADVEFGRLHFGVDIREQTLDRFRETERSRHFDVVSMFGVLHCVEEPLALLREAAAVVRDGGLVAFEVGNFDAVTRLAVQSFPHHPTRSAYNGVTTLHQFTEASVRRALASVELTPVSVWSYGADMYELINQWCAAEPVLAGSPLEHALCTLANEMQMVIDRAGQGSNMLWIARRVHT